MKKILLLISLLVILKVNSQTLSLNSFQQISGTQQISCLKLVKDTDGNNFIIGTFRGTVDFDFGTNVNNVTSEGTMINTFLLKTSSSGSFIWVKTFSGGATNGLLVINDIIVNSSNIYISGNFSETVDFDPTTAVVNKSVTIGSFSNTTDFFVAKYDLNMNLVWVQTTGSVGSDELNAIAVDASGNVHAVGLFVETVDFDTSTANTILNPSGSGGGKRDGFYWKLNETGTFSKAFKIGGIFYDDVREVIVDDSSVILMGLFSDTVDFDPSPTISNLVSSSGTDTFVVKLDLNHNFISSCKVGSDSVFMKRDSSGNFFLVGRTGNSLSEDFDPSTATFFVPTSTFARVYILKLTANFNFVWVKTFAAGTGNQSELMDFEIDSSNNLYTLGRFKGTADFDPSSTVYNLVSGSSYYQTFIHKLTNDGDFVFANMFQTYSNDYAFLYDMAINSDLTIDLAGQFDGSFYISPNSFSSYVTNSGQHDGLLLRFSQAILNTESFEKQGISLYPNPVSSQLNLSFENNLEAASFKIISITGQTVFEKNNVSGSTFSLDVSNFTKGVYVVQVMDSESLSTSKFIKQ